jgi:DNA-binding response OmpR family regulator
MTESHYQKVLVADDERVIADSLALILCRSGFDARAAYTGSMAVAMAQSFQPDVMIADVVMPFMSGIEAAIRVREMLPSCRIVLFSGQAATADLLEMAHARVREFELLVKPVHPSELIARLRRSMAA